MEAICLKNQDKNNSKWFQLLRDCRKTLQQSEWSFAPFFIGCVALSIIVTPLFNQSNGSILLTAFFHFMLMNPVFPDAQPYDTYIISVVAIIVVWVNRKTMFAKEGAITRVIPLIEKTNNNF